MWYKVNKRLIGTQQVRPSWWKPNANTVAYYPLNSNTTVNDMSGNNMNLTNYSATFWIYQWVNSVNIVWDSKCILWYISSIPQWANARTFNFWTYNSNGSATSSSWVEAYFFTGTENTNQMILFMCSEDWANYNRVSQYWAWSWTNFWTPKRQQWVNMCLVYDWTKFICYENWIKKGKWTYTINTSWTKFSLWVKRNGSVSWWNKFSWYFSNFIIENKTWTDEEILSYYNQTKSNYWL